MRPKLNRRQVLATGAAFAAFGAGRASAAAPGELEARVADIQLLPGKYGQTRIWGFGGRAPGPEIRVVQGARVQTRVINNLPDATSTHWHGIRIDNAMDGVAGLTQEAIAPGASFDYDFVAPDAGTFWYHAHDRSFEQVRRLKQRQSDLAITVPMEHLCNPVGHKAVDLLFFRQQILHAAYSLDFHIVRILLRSAVFRLLLFRHLL